MSKIIRPSFQEQTKQQRKEATNGVAEEICDEIIPNVFHDADDKAWIRLPRGNHFETLVINSREMVTFLQREFWDRMKREYGHGCYWIGQLLVKESSYWKRRRNSSCQ